MKLFLISLLSLSVVTAEEASNEESSESHGSDVTGFYSGAETGIGFSKVQTKLPSIGAQEKIVYNKYNSNKNVGIFGAFVGYGASLNNFYLGAELESLFVPTNNKKKHPVKFGAITVAKPTVSVKRNFSVPISFRFGYVFCGKTILFGRVGVDVAKYKLSISEKVGNKKIEYIKGKSKGTVALPILGVGVDHFFTKNIFVRAQYDCTFGTIATLSPSKYSLKTFNLKEQKKDVKYHLNTIKVGVGYKF